MFLIWFKKKPYIHKLSHNHSRLGVVLCITRLLCFRNAKNLAFGLVLEHSEISEKFLGTKIPWIFSAPENHIQ
ncbi:hypothetical protein CMI48_00170 [Candidatus Pacearchaeota archaeon]|nr:hypothetical protein [Candidatus Pacearchaeota archaeon]